MKNKEYVNAFAGVGPSAGAVERILQMEQKTKPRYAKKALVSLLAAALLLGALALTANAATEGHLYEGVMLIMSGEKLDLGDFIRNYEQYVDENGVYVRRAEVTSPDGRTRHWVEAFSDPNGENGINVGWEIDPSVAPDPAGEDYTLDITLDAETP